jgi:hypothetical protein
MSQLRQALAAIVTLTGNASEPLFMLALAIALSVCGQTPVDLMKDPTVSGAMEAARRTEAEILD